ncbi:MAG: hypothetical protein CL609_12430 [Anaerolineaceae bacterium]|nr:hypothetical protein [Anaerolineaceae bacterium]
MKSHTLLLKFLIIVTFISLMLSGCSQKSARDFLVLPTQTPTITPTATPTITPIPIEDLVFGTETNPYIVTYINNTDENLNSPDMDIFIQNLSEQTGFFFQYQHFNSARDAFEALRKGEVHFVWLHPLTYLAAKERDLINPLFVTNHFGLYQYGFQFISNVESNFFSYFDENTNLNTAEAGIALRQFEGKRPCFVNDSSLSSAIAPQGLMSQNGIQNLDPVMIQTHTGIVRALYIKGICDFGVTFAYTGDPRTSSQVINDLPDALQKVQIIWRSEPIIPSLAFAVQKDVPLQVVEKTTTYLSVMSQSSEGKELLTKSLRYDVQNLRQIDDRFFSQVKELIYAANVIPYQFLGY